MTTKTLEISITLDELRETACEIANVLRGNEAMTSIPNERLPVIHAYMLGTIMRAVGITPGSCDAVLEFVSIGYRDYDAIKEGDG